jgi:hypothetical protein
MAVVQRFSALAMKLRTLPYTVVTVSSARAWCARFRKLKDFPIILYKLWKKKHDVYGFFCWLEKTRLPAKNCAKTRQWAYRNNKSSESIATLPTFGPIEGQKWFDQISSQWESKKNRFAFISFGKIQFLPPCIWNLPFMSYHLGTLTFR